MKKLRNCFCGLLVSVLTIIGSVSNVYASTDILSTYDSQVINMANTYVDSSTTYGNADLNPFIKSNGGRYFTVNEIETDHFDVNVNGVPITVIISQNNSVEQYKPQNVTDLDDNSIINIIESSRKKVDDYIETSSILIDKDNIENYINSLSIKAADFTDDSAVGAYFSADDSVIYVNNELSEYVCEWMVCHEYMHAIAYFTHGEIDLDEVPYAYSLYNEVWTDLLTSSMDPEINESIESYYKGYYTLLYPYINIFGDETIKSYFYGYNSIYQKTSKSEFDFFVDVFENFGQQNSEVYYNNLVLKWYAKNLC